MSDLIARATNLNLVFKTSLHRPWTWREAFVRSMREPLEVALGAGEDLHTLKDINLELKRGDRVGLIGVNGVGKTSLCRCMAGFYRPTSGKVERSGTLRALFEVAVGVQQELTGRENAWLLAQLMFPGEGRLRETVEEALEFSELGRFVDVPFRLYSKGMQARLGLSLAALRPADLLILDEVFDGADVFFREKISKRMADLMRESGAVIFVSHSPDQVRQFCNRVFILNNGHLSFAGPVEEGLEAFEKLRPSPAPDKGENYVG